MSELVRGTEAQQRRTLIRAGAIVAILVAIVVTIVEVLPSRRPETALDVVMSTPTVGPGLDVNSHVLLRGVVVGYITALERRTGRVAIHVRLNRNQIRGLTDSFRFDFRPENNFGLTALNITPSEGGLPLMDGQYFDRSPDINATMAELLKGQVGMVTGVLTDKLVQLIERAADYTVALAPFIESGLVLTNLIAETQRRMPGEIIQQFNDIVAKMPEVADLTLSSIHRFRYLKDYEMPIADIDRTLETTRQIDVGLFGPLNDILTTHRTELTPSTEIVRSFADSVSALVQRSRGSMRLDKVLAGLADSYSGAQGLKSVKLRLVLEPLPVIESVMPAPADLDGNHTR